MNVKKNSILGESEQVKSFIEKNRKLPMTCTLDTGNTITIYSMSYLMAKQLVNWSVNGISTVEVVKYNTTPYVDKINNVKVKKNVYLDMSLRFVKYCEKNHRVPSNIIVTGERGSASFELFTYCLSKILTYLKKNGTFPNYCLFNKADIQNTKSTSVNTKKKTTSSTSNKTKTVKENCKNPYTSTPHYTTKGCNKLGQCTSYYCGPHSIHQAMRKYGITKYNEKTLASWCGTTHNGTDHQGINTCIAKIGKQTNNKFKVTWKNYSDMGKNDNERMKNIAQLLCQPKYAIIWHIAYINGGTSTSGKHFGHYEYIDKINTSTSYVRALNSLGDRNSDGSYDGRLQDRKYNVQSYFARNTPGNQSALCIIEKQ